MLHVKYFNLNTIQQTWHRITVNISAIFIPFFLKSFLRWYDFSLQRYLDSKGKIISNVSLSLSHSFAPRYWQLHACHECTGQWRTSSTLFFFFFQLLPDATYAFPGRNWVTAFFFFFRNGGRHSRFSSAFNVTFDLSYLASHLSYRLRTKCILKWKSLVVGRILKNDISRLIQFS